MLIFSSAASLDYRASNKKFYSSVRSIYFFLKKENNISISYHLFNTKDGIEAMILQVIISFHHDFSR